MLVSKGCEGIVGSLLILSPAQYKIEIEEDTIDDFYKLIAKKLGININRKLEMDENGSFVPATLQVNVNQDATKGKMYAVIHESVGEVLRAFAPEEYNNIKHFNQLFR